MQKFLVFSRLLVAFLAITLFTVTQGCSGSTVRQPTNVGMVTTTNHNYGGIYQDLNVSYSGDDAFATSVNTCVNTYTGGARIDIDRRTMIVSTCQNLIRSNIPAPQWGMSMMNWGWNGGYGNQFFIPGRFYNGAPYVSYKLTNLIDNKNGH